METGIARYQQYETTTMQRIAVIFCWCAGPRASLVRKYQGGCPLQQLERGYDPYTIIPKLFDKRQDSNEEAVRKTKHNSCGLIWTRLNNQGMTVATYFLNMPAVRDNDDGYA
jgi:hypothetical protein